MTGWNPLLGRHWFPAALSSAVRTAPSRVVIFAKPVVLVRGSDGAVWAMEDRCPHRGAALSAGKMSSHGLACPYHGWAFDADGRCTVTPGTGDGRPIADLRVAAFQVMERDGLVWVSSASGNALPERVAAMKPEQNRFRWQTRWGAPILDAQENFLDALHTHTVHPGLVRGADVRRPVDVKLQVCGDGFVVDYKGQGTQSGLLFRLFESPRTRERAYFSGLSTAQIEYGYRNGSTIWITLYFTPETERSTHVFATLHVENRWAPRWLVRSVVWPFLRRVAAQDQAVLEQQQALRDYFPSRRAAVTQLDIARPYIEAAWQEAGQALPKEVNQTFYL